MSSIRCEWCDKTFERPHTKGPLPRFCTPAHRQRAYEERQRTILAEQVAKIDAIGAQLAAAASEHTALANWMPQSSIDVAGLASQFNALGISEAVSKMDLTGIGAAASHIDALSGAISKMDLIGMGAAELAASQIDALGISAAASHIDALSGAISKMDLIGMGAAELAASQIDALGISAAASQLDALGIGTAVSKMDLIGIELAAAASDHLSLIDAMSASVGVSAAASTMNLIGTDLAALAAEKLNMFGALGLGNQIDPVGMQLVASATEQMGLIGTHGFGLHMAEIDPISTQLAAMAAEKMLWVDTLGLGTQLRDCLAEAKSAVLAHPLATPSDLVLPEDAAPESFELPLTVLLLALSFVLALYGSGLVHLGTAAAEDAGRTTVVALELLNWTQRRFPALGGLLVFWGVAGIIRSIASRD